MFIPLWVVAIIVVAIVAGAVACGLRFHQLETKFERVKKHLRLAESALSATYVERDKALRSLDRERNLSDSLRRQNEDWRQRFLQEADTAMRLAVFLEAKCLARGPAGKFHKVVQVYLHPNARAVEISAADDFLRF